MKVWNLNSSPKVSEAGKPICIEFIRMELGEPDASGRRRPIEIPGSEFRCLLTM